MEPPRIFFKKNKKSIVKIRTLMLNRKCFMTQGDAMLSQNRDMSSREM